MAIVRKDGTAPEAGPRPINPHTSPQMRTALGELNEQIAAQLRHKLNDLRREQPAWLRSLPERPNEPRAAQRWDATVQEVMLHRARYNVTTSASAIGPEPKKGTPAARSHRTVTEFVKALRTPTPAAAPRSRRRTPHDRGDDLSR